jgi:hypothetical protein
VRLWNSSVIRYYDVKFEVFTAIIMMKVIGVSNLYTGRNISAVWRNILPPSSILKTEVTGPTKPW